MAQMTQSENARGNESSGLNSPVVGSLCVGPGDDYVNLTLKSGINYV